MTVARRTALAVLLLPLLLAISARPVAGQSAGAATGFRVVIDAGHGGSDPGAISQVAPLVEKDVTLRLALLTGAALQRRGVGVVYTRTDDRQVSLAERASLPQRVGAQVMVSLHLNSASNPLVSGAEAWYGNGQRDHALAEALLNGLAPVLQDHGLPLRGTRAGPDLAVLKGTVPAVLVEAGYVSHAREAQLLNQSAYLQRLAEGLASGIVRFRDGSGPAIAPRLNAASPLPGVYFVRPGDTLSDIANRFRMAVDDLLQLNPVVDPRRLLPGAPLRLGAGSAEAIVASWSSTQANAGPAPRGPAPASYTVAPGDTLSAIAVRFGLAVDDVVRWNGIEDADRVRAGERLRLTAPSGSTGTGSTGTGGGPARRYRVEPGDTLTSIARRHGVTIGALAAANALSDPDRVIVGMTLSVPGR